MIHVCVASDEQSDGQYYSFFNYSGLVYIMGLDATLLQCGLVVSMSDMSDDLIRRIKKQLTITTKSFNGWDIHTRMYSQTRSHLIMPRFTKLKNTAINIINGLGVCRRGTFDGFCATLTHNQTVVTDHIMNTYLTRRNRRKGLAGVIVNMPPGEGKTFVSMAIMYRLVRKVAIIVPNTYLLKQWFDTCSRFFPSTTIGVYYGTHKSDGDIVIHVINSALVDTFKKIKRSINDKGKLVVTGVKDIPADVWWARFGLIIYDEVHMYCSESRAKIFSCAQAQYMLGLSATPNQRLDKLDSVALLNIGPVLNTTTVADINKVSVAYTTDVKVIRYKCESKYGNIEVAANGMVSVPRMINNFVLDPVRNAIIIKEAMRLYKLGLCIFVFTDRRDHADYLVETLRSYEYEYGRDNFHNDVVKKNTMIDKDSWGIIYDYLYPVEMDVIALLGGASDGVIHEAKSNSRIIVTTYAYSSTGVSIDKLNAAILSTPRKSNMIQILGRIYRLSGDPTITRRIVDIVDWNTPLKKQYYERRKVYSGASIEVVDE